MDEYSRIRQATIGSTSASWGYDSNNMLSQIAATGVQQYNYSFDVNLGNLNSRTNFLKSKTESFGYDSNNLDRLATVIGPVNASVTYTTDKNGNIQTKSDAGTYAYNLTPYAVSDIGNHQNISSTPQSINYYSFEKVQDITEGSKTAEFVYNTDQQRIRMTLKTSGATTKTRWYFGGSCEREQVGSTVTQYIWIGGDAYSAVAVAKKVGTGNWTVYNIFRDHLGTITHLKTGSTISEYSFDAWGRRRDKDDWTYTLSTEPALFADRGFTAHEYLDDFKLYNMNGRMYDPVVGRFLSPDPFIQAPDFSQNYNRYSYALNNPLVYTDPSGEIFWFIAAGALVGAYFGGTMANNDWNPLNWDYKSANTWIGMIGGGIAGGLGGYMVGTGQMNLFVGMSSNFGQAGATFSFAGAQGVGGAALAGGALGGGGALTGWALTWETAAGGGGRIDMNGNNTTPEQNVDLAIAEATSGWAVTAATGYMAVLQADVFTPDPSDALWPKWAGHAVLGTASSLVLYSAGKNILNPNLEGTTTSRGNPTDWSFDPEINRLQNDKYYPPGSKPPGWFWPAVGAAGAHELYQNWPKPNIPQHTQPVDNTYVSPRPIYPYGY